MCWEWSSIVLIQTISTYDDDNPREDFLLYARVTVLGHWSAQQWRISFLASCQSLTWVATCRRYQTWHSFCYCWRSGCCSWYSSDYSVEWLEGMVLRRWATTFLLLHRSLPICHFGHLVVWWCSSSAVSHASCRFHFPSVSWRVSFHGHLLCSLTSRSLALVFVLVSKGAWWLLTSPWQRPLTLDWSTPARWGPV